MGKNLWWAIAGCVWLPCVIALLAAACAAPAGAGAEVGVRLGWVDGSGEVFEGGGDLGGTDLVGIQLAFDLLPVIQTEIAGEYVAEPFGFSEGLFEGIEAAGSGDYEDLSIWFSGRAQVFSLLFLPIHGYVGGGLNVHFVDLKIDEDLVPAETTGAPARLLSPAAWDEDLQQAVSEVAGERTRVGWHLLAGARLSFSGIPLAAFLEGRYSDAFDEGVPVAKSLYLGLSLAL